MKKLSLKIEFILMIILAISFITSLFTKVYWYSQIVMGITLLFMGYNNQEHFKRKHMTYVYYIFGVIVIVFTIAKQLHG